EESARIPVILLVGSFESFDENEARRVGANDWMTKPFQSIRQLVTKVTTLLSEPAASNGEGHAEPAQPEPISYETQRFDPPLNRAKDNDDIDSLYRQSMTETVPLPSTYKSEHGLGDTGMDDEMIETSYVGSTEVAATEYEMLSSSESVAAEPVSVSHSPN